MKYIRLPEALLFISAALLCGCATPKYNYQPEAKDVSTPPLNTVSVANVGDEMLKQGKFVEREAIQIDRNIKIGIFGYYTLLPGYYIKTGEDDNSEFYRPADGPDGGRVVKAALSDPWESIQLYKHEDKVGVVTVFHAHVMESAIGVKRTTHLLLSDNSFQQTLIYSGKVGSKIKIGYREFSNNQARPAFNNDVDYDLNESTTIGYKGARLEILEATNQFVRYKVLQNFNQAVY
jgi:hypothetical protein